MESIRETLTQHSALLEKRNENMNHESSKNVGFLLFKSYSFKVCSYVVHV